MFSLLSANQMEWKPMDCLPVTHVQWEVRRPIEQTLAPFENQLCKEPWWMMDQEARINIELSFLKHCAGVTVAIVVGKL